MNKQPKETFTLEVTEAECDVINKVLCMTLGKAIVDGNDEDIDMCTNLLMKFKKERD